MPKCARLAATHGPARVLTMQRCLLQAFKRPTGDGAEAGSPTVTVYGLPAAAEAAAAAQRGAVRQRAPTRVILGRF